MKTRLKRIKGIKNARTVMAAILILSSVLLGASCRNDDAGNRNAMVRISPFQPLTTITAISPSLTATTVVNQQGKFVIKGLPAGTYGITVTPDLPLLPLTLTGISVIVGATTDLGVISL